VNEFGNRVNCARDERGPKVPARVTRQLLQADFFAKALADSQPRIGSASSPPRANAQWRASRRFRNSNRSSDLVLYVDYLYNEHDLALDEVRLPPVMRKPLSRDAAGVWFATPCAARRSKACPS
jgi:hypothetical protein